MNIKIKKKILVCMLWLCAIACFTGFPWIFFSWDVIHSYMGIHDIPSDLTIVLFREECLFFGFFCIYFLFLRNNEEDTGSHDHHDLLLDVLLLVVHGDIYRDCTHDGHNAGNGVAQFHHNRHILGNLLRDSG